MAVMMAARGGGGARQWSTRVKKINRRWQWWQLQEVELVVASQNKNRKQSIMIMMAAARDCRWVDIAAFSTAR